MQATTGFINSNLRIRRPRHVRNFFFLLVLFIVSVSPTASRGAAFNPNVSYPRDCLHCRARVMSMLACAFSRTLLYLALPQLLAVAKRSWMK